MVFPPENRAIPALLEAVMAAGGVFDNPILCEQVVRISEQ
jgi:hypothetical protein